MSSAALGSVEAVSSLRHRITFGTSRGLAYISVLELGTLWERTLRRARVPLRYSQGYNPRPRMHFAAPLPVGCSCRADLLDVSLEEPQRPNDMWEALRPVLPPHLVVTGVATIDERAPALSEQLIAAEYRVWLHGVESATIEAGIERLMAVHSMPMPRRGRRHRGRLYDLRPLVNTLQLETSPPAPWIGILMRLSARPGETGRPDEVLKALNLQAAPRRCVRTQLLLDATRSEEVT